MAPCGTGSGSGSGSGSAAFLRRRRGLTGSGSGSAGARDNASWTPPGADRPTWQNRSKAPMRNAAGQKLQWWAAQAELMSKTAEHAVGQSPTTPPRPVFSGAGGSSGRLPASAAALTIAPIQQAMRSHNRPGLRLAISHQPQIAITGKITRAPGPTDCIIMSAKWEAHAAHYVQRFRWGAHIVTRVARVIGRQSKHHPDAPKMKVGPPSSMSRSRTKRIVARHRFITKFWRAVSSVPNMSSPW